MSKRRSGFVRMSAPASLARRRQCSVLLIWVAALVAMPAVRLEAAGIPTPSWVEKTSVADTMIINGLPSKVHYFKAGRKLDELLEFYRKQWDESRAGKSGYREAAVFPWHVISRLDGRHLLTVQAKAKDAFTSEGYLAVADLKEPRKQKIDDQRIPQMAGSKVINDAISYDPGKKARTLMIVNRFSVARNSGFYRDYFLDRGWGQLNGQEADGAQVLSFRRFGEEAHIVIKSSSQGAVTVLNMVKAD